MPPPPAAERTRSPSLSPPVRHRIRKETVCARRDKRGTFPLLCVPETLIYAGLENDCRGNRPPCAVCVTPRCYLISPGAHLHQNNRVNNKTGVFLPLYMGSPIRFIPENSPAAENKWGVDIGSFGSIIMYQPVREVLYSTVHNPCAQDS